MGIAMGVIAFVLEKIVMRSMPHAASRAFSVSSLRIEIRKMTIKMNGSE